MEDEYVSDLHKSLMKYHQDSKVPRFNKVAQILYNIFALSDGPAFMLISHYYYTAQTSTQTIFEKDPLLQLKWCQEHLAYFSRFCKRLRTLRNKLVHKSIVWTRDIVNMYVEMYNMKWKGSTIDYLFDVLIGQTEIVIHSILNKDACNNYSCPKCLRPFIDKEQSRTLKKTRIDESLQPSQTIYCLADLKLDPHMKEYIKGRSIIIKSGYDYGRKGIFRSWSGTVASIDLEDRGLVKINIHNCISFLE